MAFPAAKRSMDHRSRTKLHCPDAAASLLTIQRSAPRGTPADLVSELDT